MFNIKVYNRNWVFIQTLRESEISCKYSFSASVNSGFSSLSFEYYWDYKLEHKQRIKIYKQWKAIYQWFITWVSIKADKSGKKQIIKCSWLLWLLSFTAYQDWTLNINPGVFIRNTFNSLGFDVSPVRDYTSSISIESENNTTLSLLQEILNQTSDYAFFIDAENKVWFTPYETHHLLTFNDDCYNIDLSEDSTNYFNSITLKYSWGSVTWSNASWIAKYWTNQLVVDEQEIKDNSTANLRLNSLLKEKDIVRNYKVSVNSNYDYFSIKPWDILSVRNTEWIIENKPVKKVNYNQNTAEIILDSYQSLETFIINSK
jgi:hypothetical protein